MKKISKHIKSILCLSWALIFLICVSGFSFYKQSCSISKTEQFSLISSSNSCNHNHKVEDSDACCSENESIICYESEKETDATECCQNI